MTPAMTPADPLQNQSPFNHVSFQVEFPYPTVLPCISALGIFTNKGYLHAVSQGAQASSWSRNKSPGWHGFFSPGFSWKIDIQRDGAP